MQTTLNEEREAVAEFGCKLLKEDLTTGTGGNISVMGANQHIAMSPSGISYQDVSAADVPVVDLEGDVVSGSKKPSSETPMHLHLYRSRKDVNAVVHTHSPYATTFASLDEPIPASHYLVGFAGKKVPVTDYATFATNEIGKRAAETLGDEYDACLLQNHGSIAVGDSVDTAFENALMVEFVARIHYQARSIGDPVILPDKEIEHVRSKFKNSYGQANQDSEQ